jgi:hypothetical protein
MPNTSATSGYLTPSAPALDDDALVDLITEAVAGITGLDGSLVRPKWQPKPPKRPAASTDWAAVGITESQADAGPYIVHDPNAAGGAGSDTLTRHSDVTVHASFYGPNAKGNAHTLVDGLGLPQNLETLQENSISFVSAGTIRAVPESVNMQWVERYDLLLTFRRTVTRTYAVQTVETIGVELHVDDHVTNINP